MIEQDAYGEAFGPKLQGAHKGLEFLAHGFAFDSGRLEPCVLPKDALGELADNPRDGEALLRVLQALVGSDAVNNDHTAISTRTEELLRQLDPTHVIPPHRKRTKQTASHAGKTVFKALGIDRVNTGRSLPADQRKHIAEAVKDKWREKKNPAATTQPGFQNEADARPHQVAASQVGGR